MHGRLVAKIRNGFIHGGKNLLGSGGLGHLEVRSLHHHGAGLVGEQIETVHLANHVSGLGSRGNPHHQSRDSQRITKHFHGILHYLKMLWQTRMSYLYQSHFRQASRKKAKE